MSKKQVEKKKVVKKKEEPKVDVKSKVKEEPKPGVKIEPKVETTTDPYKGKKINKLDVIISSKKIIMRGVSYLQVVSDKGSTFILSEEEQKGISD